jgi:pimeloyl-ACP methyl ester carboxylesterase
MVMKNKILLLVFLLPFLQSCLRLDSNLFNTEEKISAYKLDAYTGNSELKDLPSGYNIPDSLIRLFNLESNDAGSKAKIWCIYLGDPTTISTDTVILYCHGNKNHMDNYWNRAKLLAHVGGKNRFGVLMMDYRGYGLSEGDPTESGLYADVTACLQWLKDQGLKSGNLVMYGYSLGSAPATKLSVENKILPVSKLILEAPYASAQVMTEDAAKLSLPASYFTNVKVNNEEEIKKLTIPFCWFHGEDDDFLSRKAHGQKVYDACKGPWKEGHVVPKAVHNNLPFVMGYEPYLKTLETFILR